MTCVLERHFFHWSRMKSASGLFSYRKYCTIRELYNFSLSPLAARHTNIGRLQKHTLSLWRPFRYAQCHRMSTFERNTVEKSSDEESPGSDGGSNEIHVPVMKREVLEMLNPQDGQLFVDMTFGAGGHTKAILETNPGITVIALDRDPQAHGIALSLKKQYGNRLTPLQGRFSDLHDLLTDIGVQENSIDGALFDCGASSMQFETDVRGFSMIRDGPLDMRMDWNRDPSMPTAADVVNHLSEQGLYQILKKYGEEKQARVIAQAIVDSRYTYGKYKTTKQLAKVVESAVSGPQRKDMLRRHAHAATKTFQALRIFVNDELNELHNGLEQVHQFLKPERGICVTLSFHSLEDRIIKRHFHGIDIDAKSNMSVTNQMKLQTYGLSHSAEEMADVMDTKWTPVSKRVMVAEKDEVDKNPRSRSAKLRAAFKTGS